MDLTYRILWFDDQPRMVEGYNRNIEQRLNGIGLRLKHKLIQSFDEESIAPLMRNLKSYCPYDLIMVDYDLGIGNHKGGEKLLKRLRNSTHCEMIFYSSAPPAKLRKELVDNKIDGVFVTNRTDIKYHVQSIAESALRRIIHPNYMRGLVVGSVSEMEHLFCDVIASLCTETNTCTEELLNNIVQEEISYLNQQVSSRHDQHIKKQLKFEKQLRRASLHTKSAILIDLLEKEGSKPSLDAIMVLEEFMNEINQPRIEFAHAKTCEEDDIPVFKDRNNKRWGPNEMKKLLLDIRRHKDSTYALHERLSRQQKK